MAFSRGLKMNRRNIGKFLEIFADGNDDPQFNIILETNHGHLVLGDAGTLIAGSKSDSFSAISISPGPRETTLGWSDRNIAPAAGIKTGRPGGVPGIGFFGQAPHARPAHPVTLANVIQALTDLGLVAP